MEDRRKIPRPGGGEAEGIKVPFRPSMENWNEYFLDDGSVVKLKVVVTDIMRILDEFDDGGEPLYVVKSMNVVSVSAPKSLRREGT